MRNNNRYDTSVQYTAKYKNQYVYRDFKGYHMKKQLKYEVKIEDNYIYVKCTHGIFLLEELSITNRIDLSHINLLGYASQIDMYYPIEYCIIHKDNYTTLMPLVTADEYKLVCSFIK